MFRTSLVVHHQEHDIIYCITQFGTVGTIVLSGESSCFEAYCKVLMTNEMHSSYNQLLFHSFLSALHVSNESCRSSSGAQRNILYYTIQLVQSCYQASLAAS